MEAWIQNKARGLYRWENPEQGWKQTDPHYGYDEGDAIKINPIPEYNENSYLFWPVYATFIEYMTDEIAKVYIPSGDDEAVWFQEGEGEYLIHEGYITPQ